MKENGAACIGSCGPTGPSGGCRFRAAALSQCGRWAARRAIGRYSRGYHALKETEAALRESELRLRLALEAAQMGTFEADIGGSQAIIDAQEAHLLGLPPKTRLVSSEELRARIPL